MKNLYQWPAVLAIGAAGFLAGCSQTPKAPYVADRVSKAISQAGLRNVSVTQDRNNGVVTLTGTVGADQDKAQALSIAQPLADGQVVANEIAVVPGNAASAARSMNSDLDKGIEQNLDAALIYARLHDYVKYTVKNHVVTLTGDVDSASTRASAESVAASVPNVQQVVNEIQVKNQKATSTQ